MDAGTEIWFSTRAAFLNAGATLHTLKKLWGFFAISNYPNMITAHCALSKKHIELICKITTYLLLKFTHVIISNSHSQDKDLYQRKIKQCV